MTEHPDNPDEIDPSAPESDVTAESPITEELAPAEPTPAFGLPVTPGPHDLMSSGPLPLSMPPFISPNTRSEPPATAAGPPPAAPGGGWPPSGSGGWTPYSGQGWPAPGGWFAAGAPAQHSAPRRHAMVALLLGALIAGGLGAGIGVAVAPRSSSPAAALVPPTTSPATNPLPGTGAINVAQIAQIVTPAVVDIMTTVATPTGQNLERAAGTGMILTSNGLVLTNNHVVEQAQTIHVAVQGRSQSYTGVVVGTSESHDVALVQIEGASGLPTVALGNSSQVQVGDNVVAIGNADGLGGTPTSVSGAISATGRTISAATDNPTDLTKPETLEGLFQTSAEIVPGDSGGPLVDGRGQVIGMDTAAANSDTGSSIGFAIPINEARSLALDIEHHETPTGTGIVLGLVPYMGVDLCEPQSGGTSATQAYETCLQQESGPFNGFGGFGGFGSAGGFGNTGNTGNASSCPSGQVTATSGAFVLSDIQNAPAVNAGIEPGDVITAIGGDPIPSWSAAISVVHQIRIGSTVPVKVVTPCGATETKTVTIGGIPQ